MWGNLHRAFGPLGGGFCATCPIIKITGHIRMDKDQIEVGSFVEKETVKIENRVFIGKLVTVALVYLFASILLSNFRDSAPIALVWILIGVQLLAYVGIFIMSYRRATEVGLDGMLAAIALVFLAIAGRSNDWEFVIIPLLLVVMIVLSARNKKLSREDTMNTKHPRMWKGVQVLASTYVFLWLVLGIYGNHYFPHGPYIPTGEYECANEGRSPCREITIEDTRNLDVPDWVKFLRDKENELMLLMMVMFILALHAHGKLEDQSGSSRG